MSGALNLTLRVWRQAGPDAPGKFVDYQSKNLNPNMSFLEMLDVVNDELTTKGEDTEVTSYLAMASALLLCAGAALTIRWFGRVP